MRQCHDVMETDGCQYLLPAARSDMMYLGRPCHRYSIDQIDIFTEDCIPADLGRCALPVLATIDRQPSTVRCDVRWRQSARPAMNWQRRARASKRTTPREMQICAANKSTT